MKLTQLALVLCPVLLLSACNDDDIVQAKSASGPTSKVQLGPRPGYLVNQLAAGTLKDTLSACLESKSSYQSSYLSIGHRGAPLMFPEHTREGYIAAASMGAGVIECDVALTKDGELVCRHSHADLHTTTNVLAVPELAAKCSQPFTPADPVNGLKANAECRTSDFTLAEYKSLQGKMDSSNANATSVQEYMQATPNWRTDLYANTGTLMSHKESIALFRQLGVKMTPELKTPSAQDLAAAGMTQQQFAQKMIDEYTEAGVEPSEVYPQSFLIDDLEYWLANNSDYGQQGVFLVSKPADVPSPSEIAAKGIKIVAPIYTLLVEEQNGELQATDYAKELKAQGLDLITWSLERRYTSYPELAVLDVLKQQLGVIGVFSDWPATVTFYDNCTQ
ncbi:glycerophosphodiester phosphodiesterase family protein [Agarivorans sp. QJM3NY_33]|uniref:glycerophosphodiester phosphodiesterase family protein n=1 Tax=Agarivorans sp. QJM3NY_33 TaxID=3421432 RepID=UPI003D7F15A8